MEDQINENRGAVVRVAKQRKFSLSVTRKGQESSGSSSTRRKTRSHCTSSASTVRGSVAPGKRRGQGKDRERGSPGYELAMERRVHLLASYGVPGTRGGRTRQRGGDRVTGGRGRSPWHRSMTVLCSQVAVLPDWHGGRGHQLALCEYHKVQLREKETFKHL